MNDIKSKTVSTCSSLADTSISFADAIGAGKFTYVKELIAAGVDVNAWYKWSGNIENRHCFTPLMIIAIGGQVECLKELIAAGADVNKRDADDRTALIFASEKGHTDCVKALITVGARANVHTVKADNDVVLGHLTPGQTMAELSPKMQEAGEMLNMLFEVRDIPDFPLNPEDLSAFQGQLVLY